MKVLEKIYGNIGKGYGDLYCSKEITQSFNKKITPLAVYKGNKLRFLYKNIENKYIFIQSFSLEKDSFNRGGMFLSHFFIIESEKIIDPSQYIFSESFVSTDNFKNKQQNTLFKKNENLVIKFNHRVAAIISKIITNIPKNNKLVFSINEKSMEDIVCSVYHFLPLTISKDISFSLNIEKFNNTNVCDINFVTKNKNAYPEKNILFIDLSEKVKISQYCVFVSKLSEKERIMYFAFIDNANFKLADINSSVESYSINKLGIYKTSSQDGLINTVMAITNVTSLLTFLKTCCEKKIAFDSSTTTRIDTIIYTRFYSKNKYEIVNYYKYMSILTKDNYSILLDRYYNLIENNKFYFLLCSYDLKEEKFIKALLHYKINIEYFLNFCSENYFFEQVFFIKKFQLFPMQKFSIPNFILKKNVKKEIGILDDFIYLIDKSTQRDKNIFLLQLLNNTSKDLSLLMYLSDKYKYFLFKENLLKIYTLIEQKIALKGNFEKNFVNFLQSNNFENHKGLIKIKYNKIHNLLEENKYSEKQLDKIIKILTHGKK